MRFLPIGLDVRGKSCLVVGGGPIGSRKVTNLIAAGAEVTVVSPVISDSLSAHVDSDRIRWIQDQFCDENLEGVFMVVAATDDETINADIVACATGRGILVCDASSAERSQVIFGALHSDDSDVTIAVFTDGREPAEARRTRDRIVDLLNPGRKPEGRSGPA